MQEQQKFILPENQWKMNGTVYTYDMVNKLIAFTNNGQFQTVIIYIGGLGDTILSTPFTAQLSRYCTEKNIKLIVPQFKTMPNYRTFLITSDVQDLHLIVQQNTGKQIIFLGHSSGCQVSMLYLKIHGSKNIKKVILQAPVSDVEYEQSINANLKQQLNEARQTKYFVPVSDGKIWLSERFLSLNQRYNTEDWFSTHLKNSFFQKWKQFQIPIISIICGKDKYKVHDTENYLKLGSQLFIILGASHSMEEQESRKQFFKILDQVL